MIPSLRKLDELYQEVSATVREHLGEELFFACGTLLGEHRDGGWIHEDDDMDTAYLWPHEAAFAPASLVELALWLNRFGYDAHVSQPMRTHLHVHHPDDYDARIDVFYWYYSDGELVIPSGQANDHSLSAPWAGTVHAQFEGIHGLKPIQTEAVLAQLYGSDWRTPHTGSDWFWPREIRKQERVNVVSEGTAREVETWRRPDLQFREDCEKR